MLLLGAFSKPFSASGSLLFYQAAATIVPVLLLGLVFQARIFHPRWSTALHAIVLLIVVMLMVILTEFVALGILLNGKGARIDAELVGATLLLLTLAVPLPTLISLLDTWDEKRKNLNKRDLRQRLTAIYLAIGVLAELAIFAVLRHYH